MTLEQAAAVLEVSGATLSRIETGLRVPKLRDVRDLLRAYGVTNQTRIAELTALVAEARESGWWEGYNEVDDAYATYIGLEAAAHEIKQYEATVVPAMLQTPEYLRALHRAVVNPQRERPLSERDIEKRVEVLLERQRLLESPGGPKYSVVVDEGAFTRIVGGADAVSTPDRSHGRDGAAAQRSPVLPPVPRRGAPGTGRCLHRHVAAT
jgi:transcriptional regulator with XRE-family HTH domain